MSNEKMGKLLLGLRKERNLTQKHLPGQASTAADES